MKSKNIIILFLSLLFTIPVIAEKRIYIVYGKDNETELPHEDYFCYDYRRDWTRIEIWAQNMSGPGDVAEGGFWGEPWRCYWTNGPFSSFGFQFAIKPGYQVDFSQVTGDWYLHLAIQPELEANKPIEIAFVDALGESYEVTIPGSMLPEGWQWNEIEIGMYEFADLGLDFATNGLIKPATDAQIYFRVGGVEKCESSTSRIGLDDVYLTDYNPEPESSAGLDETKQNLAYLIQGNGLLKVVNNPGNGFSIFNENGVEVKRTNENIVSVSELPSGFYFVKTKGQVIKFLKK